MADLTASDVTLSLHRGLDIARMDSGMLLVTAEVAFGDGAKEYPANGVPLPAIGNFGLTTVKGFFIEGQPGDGFVYKYDRARHTMRIWQGGAISAATVAAASAGTPAGAVAAPVFTGTLVTPTFTGTLDTPTFTGTLDTPTFTGTLDTPTLTGTAATMEAQILRWSIQNLKGADADVTNSMTTDQAAGPTNDDLIDTFAAITLGAWAYTENLEIDIPRNVCLTLWNNTAGALNMEEAAFTAVITGTFRGQPQEDTITETFTGANRAIGIGQYRWKYGVKPFDHITDVAVSGITVAQNTIEIGIGLGRLLGVPMEPKDNVVGDFVKITKNSANLQPVAYDDTNKTLDLGALADDDDFDIEVEVASIGESYTPAGTISSITPAGTISSITPAGTISSITPAGTVSSVTPEGTNTAPAFTGNALANHTHTLTGAGSAAAPLEELGNVAVAAVTLYLMILGL